jgi:hypothetical protein
MAYTASPSLQYPYCLNIKCCHLCNVCYVGLARTIYIRCIYSNFGREIIKYTVIYGVSIRLWPTLNVCGWITPYTRMAYCEFIPLSVNAFISLLTAADCMRVCMCAYHRWLNHPTGAWPTANPFLVTLRRACLEMTQTYPSIWPKWVGYICLAVLFRRACLGATQNFPSIQLKWVGYICLTEVSMVHLYGCLINRPLLFCLISKPRWLPNNPTMFSYNRMHRLFF